MYKVEVRKRKRSLLDGDCDFIKMITSKGLSHNEPYSGFITKHWKNLNGNLKKIIVFFNICNSVIQINRLILKD